MAPRSLSVATCSFSSSSGPTTLDGSDSAASLAPRERSRVAFSQRLCSSGRHQKHDRSCRRRLLFDCPATSCHAEPLPAIGLRGPRAPIRLHLGRLWREAQEAEEGESGVNGSLCGDGSSSIRGSTADIGLICGLDLSCANFVYSEYVTNPEFMQLLECRSLSAPVSYTDGLCSGLLYRWSLRSPYRWRLQSYSGHQTDGLAGTVR